MLIPVIGICDNETLTKSAVGIIKQKLLHSLSISSGSSKYFYLKFSVFIVSPLFAEGKVSYTWYTSWLCFHFHFTIIYTLIMFSFRCIVYSKGLSKSLHTLYLYELNVLGFLWCIYAVITLEIIYYDAFNQAFNHFLFANMSIHAMNAI